MRPDVTYQSPQPPEESAQRSCSFNGCMEGDVGAKISLEFPAQISQALHPSGVGQLVCD